MRDTRPQTQLFALLLSACASLTVAACSGSDPLQQPTADPAVLVPAEIVRDGSAGIEGRAGEITKEPLLVRVANKLGWGAPAVAVLWELQRGAAGEICLEPHGQCAPGPRTTLTDAIGETSVWFRLTETGNASVTARVVGIPNQVWFFVGQFED